MIQVPVGTFMGKNHHDQGDGRNTHHVLDRGDGQTDWGNRVSSDERDRATEDSISQAGAERESGEAYGDGERLDQVAGQGTVVDG